MLDLTFKIAKDTVEKTIVNHVEIQSALNPVYVEYDEETLQEKEDVDFPDEFDIVIHGDLCHADILDIHKLLEAYSTVEMRLRDGNLEIFQREREQKEEVK